MEKSTNNKAAMTREKIEVLIDGIAGTYKLDLSGKDLSGVDLSDLNLEDCNLERANLSGANLTRTILHRARMQRANLTNANLTETDLRGADLTDADLSGAKLFHANLLLARTDGMAEDNNTSKYGAVWNEEDLDSRIANIAKANPSNIQEVAASQIAINNDYYESVLKQTKRSFTPALILSIIGTSLIVIAVVFVIIAITLFSIKQPANLSYINLIGGGVSLIGGIVINVVASLNFSLYGRTLSQLTTFQAPLDRVSRFLIANSICENIEGDLKSLTRAKLVEIIAYNSSLDELKEEPISKPIHPILNRQRKAAKNKATF